MIHRSAVRSAKMIATAADESQSQLKGSITVAGGVLAHLILGTMYCWGNFLAYAPASLLFFDGLPHPGATPDAIQVMPFALVALNLGMPVGAFANKKLGPKATTLIGCGLMVLGTFMGSYQTRLLPFMLCYSLVAGVGTGMSYSTPMIAGWSWFPQSKGLVSGLILFGFGAGAFIFNKVGTGLALGGLPWGPMLRKLSVVYAIISLAGASLIQQKPAPPPAAPEPPPPPEECDVSIENVLVPTSSPEVCDAPGATFMQAVRSKRFALLWCIGLMAFTPGLTVLGLYKRFGMSSGAIIASDRFQSFVGGIGAISSGVGRVFWGKVVDKIGFQAGYTTTTVLQALLMLALPLTVGSKAAFAAAICAVLFSLGGSIAMFVTVNAQIFGLANAGEIYSLLFSAFALASVVGAKLTSTYRYRDSHPGQQAFARTESPAFLAFHAFLAFLASRVPQCASSRPSDGAASSRCLRGCSRPLSASSCSCATRPRRRPLGTRAVFDSRVRVREFEVERDRGTPRRALRITREAREGQRVASHRPVQRQVCLGPVIASRSVSPLTSPLQLGEWRSVDRMAGGSSLATLAVGNL